MAVGLSNIPYNIGLGSVRWKGKRARLDGAAGRGQRDDGRGICHRRCPVRLTLRLSASALPSTLHSAPFNLQRGTIWETRTSSQSRPSKSVSQSAVPPSRLSIPSSSIPLTIPSHHIPRFHPSVSSFPLIHPRPSVDRPQFRPRAKHLPRIGGDRRLHCTARHSLVDCSPV